MKNTIRILLIASIISSTSIIAIDFESKVENEEIENPFKDGITTIGYSSIKSTTPIKDEDDNNVVVFHGTNTHKDIEEYLKNTQKEMLLEEEIEMSSQLDKLINNLHNLIVKTELKTAKKLFEENNQKEKNEQVRINKELQSLFNEAGLPNDI